MRLIWSELMLTLIFLLFSSLAQANEMNLSFGPTLDGTIADKKMLAVDYEFQWGSFSLAPEFAEWAEPNGVCLVFGIHPAIHVVTPSGLTSRIGVGPVFITQTDDRLSSLIEFHIQARFGLDAGFFETGLQFDHFSNAGLVPPNLGRDIGSVYIGFPL
jgi:hypothetical protein